VGVGGRDGGEVRIPAPAHLDGPGARDPRPDGLTVSAGGGVLPGAPPGDAGGLVADWLRAGTRPAAGTGLAGTGLAGTVRLLVLGDLVVQVQVQFQVGDAHGNFLTGGEGERDGLL